VGVMGLTVSPCLELSGLWQPMSYLVLLRVAVVVAAGPWA